MSVEVPTDMLPKAMDGVSIYQKSVPLAPGMYRLNVVAKDIVGGNTTNYEMALNVPHYDDDKLASSSLILADTIERLPTRSIGHGQFVIGDSKVRPRLSESFSRNEKMGIYAQFYNFSAGRKDEEAEWADRIRDHQDGIGQEGSGVFRRREFDSGGVGAAGDGGETAAAAIAGAWAVHVEDESDGQEQKRSADSGGDVYGNIAGM